MSKLESLFTVGDGALILPFLDNEEARDLHVKREISYIIQRFPFQVKHNTFFFQNKECWRHKGITYYTPDYENSVYTLGFKPGQGHLYLGEYNSNLDAIVRLMTTSKYFCHPHDQDPLELDRFTIIDKTVYLSDSISLLLYSKEGLLGPFHASTEKGKLAVKHCPTLYEDYEYEIRQRELYEESLTPEELYIHHRLFIKEPDTTLANALAKHEEANRTFYDFVKHALPIFELFRNTDDLLYETEKIVKEHLPDVRVDIDPTCIHYYKNACGLLEVMKATLQSDYYYYLRDVIYRQYEECVRHYD